MVTPVLLLLVAAAPAKEALVDASTLVPGLAVDLRYATQDNFLKARMYPEDARCLLLPAAARKLEAAAKALKPKGYRLKVWDCYRPLSVQFAMWKVFPKRGYVADPNRGGSHHNRGAAVDLTLISDDGAEVEMPTGFDSFTRAAHHGYSGGTPASLEHRALLREVMEAAGFNRNPMEWWHYDLPEAITFPARDDPFT
jgi:D-alanyl-D-alanine dipeptidase